MAIKKKSESTQENISYDISINRVKQFDGSNDIAFDMTVNGITIYGCIYKQGVKEGKEYAFVSFPSRKNDSDGKYYNHVYFRINDDTLKDIEKKIEAVL